MPNDRLDALRRQRALIAQHLAWLDAEINAGSPTPDSVRAETPSSSPPLLQPPAPALPPSATAPFSEATDDQLAVANARAAAILEEYAATDRFNPEATRRGCLLFAIAVFLLGVAGLLAIYLLRYR